jgi:excisionase family DNA binding protein
LDHWGPEALGSVENSSVVPKPNYVLTSSPGKFQVVWKVEGMSLEEAEGLLHALARELGGDPAATDATRVLRLPGFANKKYETDFCVEARRESTGIYHLRDFKLHIDSQDSPSHNYAIRAKRESSSRTNLSQSEHDWAFAKRALTRGDDPEEVIQQIAQHRARDKSDPQDYACRTVTKATVELKSEADSQTHSSLTTNENNRERALSVAAPDLPLRQDSSSQNGIEECIDFRNAPVPHRARQLLCHRKYVPVHEGKSRVRRARENSIFESEERRMSLAPTNPIWIPEPALWTPEQAAVYLNVSRNTIFNLLRRKELVRRKIGGKTLIPKTSLEAFLKRDHATK